MVGLRNDTSDSAACRQCLSDAVDVCKEAFQLIFPNRFTRGVLMPTVGAPGVHLRAWTLQAAVKAAAMERLMIAMAGDLERDGERVRQQQAAQLADLQAIADRLLHDLFPSASLHELHWPFAGSRMSCFDEAMQITDAAAALAARLEALAARCPCAGSPLGPAA